MARPQKYRHVCNEPEYDRFLPTGIASGDDIMLTVDEYEVIRLIDLLKLTHVQCAAQMGISKTTVTEIYESARSKIADCIVNGRQLLITGGNYKVCDRSRDCKIRKSCCMTKEINNVILNQKGKNIMRIAVTYQDGEIFQHFGHSEQFKIYDVENGKVVNTQVVDTNGQGHGALAGFLFNGQVDVLICGGIGGGAQTALAQAGIQLFGGCSGSADDAVNKYLSGSLDYNANVQCTHHHGAHNCGHNCGEDKHGCSGN